MSTSPNLLGFLFPLRPFDFAELYRAWNDACGTEILRGQDAIREAAFSENALMATPSVAMKVAMNWMFLPQKILSEYLTRSG